MRGNGGTAPLLVIVTLQVLFRQAYNSMHIAQETHSTSRAGLGAMPKRWLCPFRKNNSRPQSDPYTGRASPVSLDTERKTKKGNHFKKTKIGPKEGINKKQIPVNYPAIMLWIQFTMWHVTKLCCDPMAGREFQCVLTDVMVCLNDEFYSECSFLLWSLIVWSGTIN